MRRQVVCGSNADGTPQIGYVECGPRTVRGHDGCARIGHGTYKRVRGESREDQQRRTRGSVR